MAHSLHSQKPILNEEEEEEGEVLVEEREEEMVLSLHSQEPIKRKAWFLKPTSRISEQNPFPSSHYKPISLSPSEAPTILFKGWHNPQRQWRSWVDKLEPMYNKLWQKVGILESIKASTFAIRRDLSSVLGVAGFWCDETNTFIFPWGEATVTLEDVIVLGGFSLLGEPVRTAEPLEGKLGELEERMNEERLEFSRRRCKKASHSEWIGHYIQGQGDEMEHIAFLSLWLSRFVFPGNSYMTVGHHVLPVAVRLARGARIALAPAVLASLYRDLRAMKDHLIRGGDDSELAVWAPLQILQLWVWERFLALRPKSQCFINSDDPRAARWHDVGKTLDFSFVMSVIESPDEFRRQSYATSLDNWRKPCFYSDGGRWVYGNASSDPELGLFACCLRDSELVGLDCIEQYLPHRVAFQFGLDQDVPIYVSRANSTWEAAWETYDIGAKNVVFYVPPRLFESDVSLQYFIWWKGVEELFRNKIKHKHQSKKRTLWDPSDTPAPVNHGSSSKSTSKKSRESHTGARKSEIYEAVKLSSKHLGTMNRDADALRETQLERRKQPENAVASNALDVDEGVAGDVTKTSSRESSYDPTIDLEEVEVPEAKLTVEETTQTKFRETELVWDLEIKRHKEEIALLESRIRELESKAKEMVKKKRLL